MDKYAELRASLGDGSFDFDQRAYMNEVRALLAERDALRDFVEAKMHHLPIEDQHVASILVGEQLKS